MSAATGGQPTTPVQFSVKVDIDAIIMQLLSVKDTPGKQVSLGKLLSVSFQ